ncbi:transcription factor GTE6-like [Ipomoea triloba]|uniref:transcription factor GTE6-like n=1 Tax=Ipomoea triloba TaxID=35885 RepID=UPI00125D7C35|nr:transcription factor GTE6-like [Ipomoea triloba]XP_031096698.1 transcription factor GTE6-like [Ipomoea triloba]
MENIYGSVTNISVMEPNEIGRAGMSITIDQMENIYGSVMEPNETGRAGNMEHFKCRVDEMSVTVDQLEQRFTEVEQFYSSVNKKQSNTPRGNSAQKDSEKEKQIANFKKRQQDASQREAAAAKRMQELMRQFGTILRQITQHKWAGPFMQPVDVEGLGLHDYYQVIEKPMDFSTIKNKMEAKDGTGYKHVREICADVRLIFKNAMKYNKERDDVHVMAKTLLGKFEEKWLLLLPKVDEEEEKRKKEEEEAFSDMKLAQEAAHAKMAKDLSMELDEIDMHLEELRDAVLQNCRKITVDEKKKLGDALTKLSSEDLNKALLIVAQNDPNFSIADEEVELDISTQPDSTLWKLKFFVQDVFEAQGKSAATEANNNNSKGNANNQASNKRKREATDALAKTSQKKSKKP